ncbi:hypothetical protein ZWY2020_029856 [Hordeum vulgare]|nr:hypothetical protein ZWY2020_029856 [Hordeum vulgare]
MWCATGGRGWSKRRWLGGNDAHRHRVTDERYCDRTCKEEITITVFYGDMVVGWADVPHFCVNKRSTADVNLKLSHTDVLLTDTLRRRLASELRSEDLEFEMEMRMVIPM